MNKKFQVAFVGVFLIAIVGLVYLNYDFLFAQKPPVPPPNQYDLDDDGIPDTTVSFSMFQALRVAYSSGGDSWKYPQSRTTLVPYSITDADTSKPVSLLQAYVFFNLASSRQVASVVFMGFAKLEVYDAQRQLYQTLGDMPIGYTVPNPQNGSDVYVISATQSAADFQSMFVPGGVNFDYTMYYVITCRDIGARVTFTDGATKDFVATGVQASQNQLWWRFRVYQSGGSMQVVSLGTEWVWK